MFTMNYKTTFPARENITMEIENNDATVGELFAHFVDMTRMLGYHPGSWQNLIHNLEKICDDNYTIYDWACDTMVEYHGCEKDKF